jgi:chromosome segregation ATPase
LKEEMTAGFEGEVAQLNEQLDQLQTQRELLESRLRDANASLEAALADRDEVAARLADAEAGRAQLEEVSRELQARVDGLAVSDAFNDIGPESPLAMAESRVAELDGAVASAASREAELREALDGTRTQVERLESNLETARARETDLQRAVETAELSRRETESALIQRTASFEGEKRQLLDKLDSSEARFVELNLEKQSLAELLAAERDNTTQLARSLNESHARLEAEGRRLAEVQQLLERAQQQRIQAEQDYEQLAASFRNVEHELQITEARSPALSGATLNEGAWEELGGLVRENVSRGWKVLDELQTVFEAFGIDRTKLTNDIAASGETLESALQRSLDHASSEIQHLRAQLLRATYIAETTTQRITELEREVAESRQTAVLEGLVSELRFEKEGLDSQLASLGTHNRTLQREIGELQHQLTSLGQSSSQAEEQRREVAFFRQNLEEANHRIAELREERDAMKRRVQDVETGRKTDAEQINTLLGDLRDLTERLADAKIERQADRQKFEQMRADLEQRIHEQVVQIEHYDKQLAESRHRLLTETEKHDRELLRVAGESRAMEEKYRALGRVQSDVAMLREENASLQIQLETEKRDALAMEESVTLISAENLKLKAASLALEQAKVNLSEELFELNRSHKELVSSFEQTRLHGEHLAAINAQLANDIGLARESQERSEREVMELRQLAAKLQTSQPNPSSLREAFRDGQRAAEAENDRLRAEVERLHDEIDRAVRDRESVRRDRDSVLSRLKREMNEIDGVLRKREDTIRTFVEHRRKFDDTPGKPPRDDTRFGTRSLRSY